MVRSATFYGIFDFTQTMINANKILLEKKGSFLQMVE